MDNLTLIETSNDPSSMTADDIASANYEVLRRAGRKASTVNQYTQTEKRWTVWCVVHNLNPMNFEVIYIDAYFQTLKDHYSRTTLQNMLSHLRKSVEAIAASSDETAAFYLRQLQAMKLYKIDASWGGTNSHKRGGKRLPTQTVYAALNASASNPLLKARNGAFYALLFFAGLRREELRQLKWSQLDFDRSVIKVVGGKKRAKDESDEIPMLGDLKTILQQWRDVQVLSVQGENRMYVICAIRKGGHLGVDKPIASGAVYELMRPYDAMPHDARHTLVTNLLEKNVPLHTTQKIARHKRGETTMGYAHAMEAEQLAKTVPNPYG
ncbi:MAG: site-specific integrase [Anaerolineae bacterium]|nr:site-specific integrase [Anaerolineae bacterium]